MRAELLAPRAVPLCEIAGLGKDRVRLVHAGPPRSWDDCQSARPDSQPMTQPGLTHSGVAADDFFRYYVDRGEPLVLATVAQTLGSTYRKAGAQMLIAGDGRVAGLLSGGCLEADLMERAYKVLQTGDPATVHYDTRSSDDVIWGIGLGCEGAMTILLSRLDRANDYQPFNFASRCRFDQIDASFAVVTQSSNPTFPLGAAFWTQNKHSAPAPVAAAMDVSTPRGAGPSSRVDRSGRCDLPGRADRIAASLAAARRRPRRHAAGGNRGPDELAGHRARSPAGLRRRGSLSTSATGRAQTFGRVAGRNCRPGSTTPRS